MDCIHPTLRSHGSFADGDPIAGPGDNPDPVDGATEPISSGGIAGAVVAGVVVAAVAIVVTVVVLKRNQRRSAVRAFWRHVLLDHSTTRCHLSHALRRYTIP